MHHTPIHNSQFSPIDTPIHNSQFSLPSRIKIGLVTACYHPVINGVTRMIDLYTDALTAAGHTVTIFTLGPPDPAEAPCTNQHHIIRSPGRPLGQTGYHAALRYTRHAQAALKQMDILHCHHLGMSIEFAHRYRRPHTPIIYTNHTRYDLYTEAYLQEFLPVLSPAAAHTAAQKLIRQLWPRMTSYTDAVIAPSPSIKQVMTHFGVTQPIHTIENGIDLTPFSQPPHPRTKQQFGLTAADTLAVYVGRLSPEKNLPLLLDAFAHAHQQRPSLHLLLVGDGPLAAQLKQQANQLAITPHIHFTGALPYTDVPSYLAAADFFVTASISEVHPLTVIEAMAAGLPILGRDAPGLRDCVTPHHSGFLVNKQPEQLTQALITLTDQPALRHQLGHAAQQDALGRFSIQRTAEQTLALYNTLLANPSRTPTTHHPIPTTR